MIKMTNQAVIRKIFTGIRTLIPFRWQGSGGAGGGALQYFLF